jgi:hypothetical protein
MPPDEIIPGVDINELPPAWPGLVIIFAAIFLLAQAYRSSAFFVELARRMLA